MPKMNLASMSVEALLQLRDDVGRVLNRKADELQRQLASLGKDIDSSSRRGARTKGRKVPAKYRGPGGETWAGRGATPKWLAAEIKAGRKKEDFLIDQSAAKAKRGPAKKRRKKK
jgi:DNA-binding protein H-NS